MTSGPDASAGTAPVSSATALESDLGEMFGDYSTAGESPDPEPTSAAGTTPAEPATGTDPEAASEPAAAGDGAATAASDGTTPEAPSEAAADESDPFADTTPATFMVNGQPVTNEDIRVFKEGGAVIRPEALPNVLNRLSERESLFERNRAQSVEYQTLAKATEWTDQASGKTYSGTEAAIEMRIGNASMYAENQLLLAALSNPDQLRELLATEQVPDGKGGVTERVILNPDALARLQRENTLQQREITAAIREHYRGVLADASRPAPAPLDFTTEAPRLITQLAQSASLDPSLLTAEDRTVLAEQLPFHVKDGSASLAWQNLAKRMMQDRAAQKASAAQIATTTVDATKRGLANMAAAARGVRPAATPAAPAPKPVSPQTERATAEGDLYDAMERASAAAIRRSA